MTTFVTEERLANGQVVRHFHASAEEAAVMHKRRREREQALDEVLAQLPKGERALASAAFIRNYARADSTVRGCCEYVLAVFGLDLRPRRWWEDARLVTGVIKHRGTGRRLW